MGRALVFHHDVPYVALRLQCEQCGTLGEREYDISTFYVDGQALDGPLNPTEYPSELLDIVQYGHLARFYLEYTQNSTVNLGQEEAQNLLGLASVCVDEALKHLRGGNQPPPEAVFAEDRRVLLQSNPDAFNRNNLETFREGILQYANKLGEVYDIRRQLVGDKEKDLQTLDRLAMQFKEDPILFPQIGRIAKELVHLEKQDHDHGSESPH